MNKTFKPKGYNFRLALFIIVVNGAQRMIDLLKKIFDAIRDIDLKTKKDPVFQTAILVGIRALENSRSYSVLPPIGIGRLWCEDRSPLPAGILYSGLTDHLHRQNKKKMEMRGLPALQRGV